MENVVPFLNCFLVDCNSAEYILNNLKRIKNKLVIIMGWLLQYYNASVLVSLSEYN